MASRLKTWVVVASWDVHPIGMTYVQLQSLPWKPREARPLLVHAKTKRAAEEGAAHRLFRMHGDLPELRVDAYEEDNVEQVIVDPSSMREPKRR